MERAKRAANNDVNAEVKEEEAKLADMKRQRRENRGKKRALPADDDEEAGGVDDELMKMMGLSGFGGSRKNN